MNLLTSQLAEFCRNHQLEEKVLISPTLAVGRQMTEQLAREGCSWVNLRVETLHTLALEIVGPELAREGIRLLSRAQERTLIEQVCLDEIEQSAYFKEILKRPGFHKALQATFKELQSSGLTLDQLESTEVNSAKIRELALIMAAYHQALEKSNRIDHSGLLRKALDQLEMNLKRDIHPVCYLIPESISHSTLEEQFLQKLTGEQLTRLETDRPENWSLHQSKLRLFHAMGEENEIREILRELLEQQIPLDQVEVLVPNESYLHYFYELSRQYQVPCSFAEGICATFTHPGQLALGFLQWLGKNASSGVLEKIIQDGSIEFKKLSPNQRNPGSQAMIRVLREAKIGWGVERYLPCIEQLEKNPEQKASQSEEEPLSPEYLEIRRQRLETLHRLCDELMKASQAVRSNQRADTSELAGTLSVLLRNIARTANEIDHQAQVALQKMLDEIAELPGNPVPLPIALERLEEAIKSTYINNSNPCPGMLHVSSYETGGYSGRNWVYVIGLDESNHPGSDLQDPILLDNEREKLMQAATTVKLPMRSDQPLEKAQALRAVLARQRGELILSYSSQNLLNDRECFPSSILLEAYRLTTNEPHADYSSLLNDLNSPAGFISTREIDLDETECWIRWIPDYRADPETLKSEVFKHYPWLKAGEIAETERASARLTPYDGYVEEAGAMMDPVTSEKPISPTSLERLAGCPFRYFLEDVLKIEKPLPVKQESDDWLDSMQLGRLAHEIFYQFMVQITQRNEKPSFSQHLPELLAVAHDKIEQYQQQNPSPSEAATRHQTESILQMCQIFLEDEEKHCQTVTPRHFEASFGRKTNFDLGSELPVEIELENGRKLSITGKIDRIDQAEDGIEIWDYKTGSSSRYTGSVVFKQGQQIQHALYAIALEKLLAQQGEPIHVVRSGYFFPSEKGKGSRIVRIPHSDGIKRVLEDLLSILCSGIFIPTPDSKSCDHCDYKSACHPEAPSRSKAMLNHPDNTVLRSMENLKNHG